MSYIKVLIGPHLTGKTDHAIQHMKLFSNCSRVSKRDIINMMCPKGAQNLPSEAVLEVADRVFISTILGLIEQERNVIVDDCNLTLIDLEKIIEPLTGLVDNISFKLFDEPIGVITRRNENRGRENGVMYTNNAILRQASQLQELKKILQSKDGIVPIVQIETIDAKLS